MAKWRVVTNDGRHVPVEADRVMLEDRWATFYVNGQTQPVAIFYQPAYARKD